MKLFKFGAWAFLLGALVGEPAQAAWNNVFQPTCFFRSRQPRVSNYVAPPVAVAYASPVAVAYASPVAAAPVCSTCTSGYSAYSAPAAPCPQKQCTTSYTQRCFYQPVTTYESRSYYEPVTTMQTSYYYEPVTSYRYSCYYDPCSCSYQQVAQPVTSYQLKAQSCPVQSWVQKCAQVPVTSYQKSCYLEPQTTCCTTTQGAPIPVAACPNGNCAPAPAYSNGAAPQPPAPAPVFDQQRSAPAGPNVGTTQYYRQSNDRTVLQTNGNWQPGAGAIPLDRMAQKSGDYIQGQVTRSDRTPRPGTQVLLVNAATGTRHEAVTNDAGRFNVPVSAGNYYVYLASRERTPTFHGQVQVAPNQNNFVNLVNQ